MPTKGKKTKTNDLRSQSPVFLSAKLSKGLSVDKEQGTMSDILLMESDREATGHGLWIDQKTIDMALASIKANGGMLRSYLTHDHRAGWQGQWNNLFEESKSELAIPGFYSGIKEVKGQLVAGTFEFYDYFRTSNPDTVNQLLEMAEKTPSLLHQSLELVGYAAYVGKDGTEYYDYPADTELMYDGMPAIRPTEVYASAFVACGAATDNLFAKLSRTFGLSKEPKNVEELVEALKQFNTDNKINATVNEEFNADSPQPNVEECLSNTQTQEKDMNLLLKALKAAIPDQARFTRALGIIAGTKDEEIKNLTADAIVQKLADEDKATELADLKAKAAQYEELSAQLEKERKRAEDAETSLSKFKTSGMEKEVPTGDVSKLTSRYTGLTAAVVAERAAKGINFAITTTSDLWEPSIWITGTAERIVKASNLLNTNAVVTSPIFNTAASGAGLTANIPFFREPDFDDAPQVEGTAPETNNLGSGKMVVPILRREWSFGTTALAGAITDTDPFGYVVGLISRIRLRQRERALLSMLTGLFGSDGTGAFSELYTGNFVEVPANITDAQLVDAEMVTEALEKLGEARAEMIGGSVLMHPKIETNLINQDLIDVVRDSTGAIVMRSYREMQVFINSKQTVRATTTEGGFVYSTYFFTPRSIAIGEKPQITEAGLPESDASISSWIRPDKNTREFYDRTTFILHPSGASWKGTPAGQSATNEELATKANWELAFNQPENVGIVLLQTNG